MDGGIADRTMSYDLLSVNHGLFLAIPEKVLSVPRVPAIKCLMRYSISLG
jgi:hypothetical protein